jgi:lysozyme family protein
MKENFERAFELLMEFEGGYSEDPDDTGGKTLYGITQNNFPKEFEEIMKIHTPEYRRAYAMDFYKKEFWDKCGCDDLVDRLDTLVFDFAVNSGISRAIRLLERTQDWQEYIFYRIDFLTEIGRGSNLKFLRGWIRRCITLWKALKE